MKIQLLSDTHLEFLQREWPGERLIRPALGADVLVLAGDIANGADAFDLFSDWPKEIPIVYVAGNHEFFGHSMDAVRLKMSEKALTTGIHYLENDRVDIAGVRFLGTTLWSDYCLGSASNQRVNMDYAQRRLYDHSLIRIGANRFSTQDALDRHIVAREWLTTELSKPFAGKTVVITHYAPHPLSVHTCFSDDPLSPASISDLSSLMPQVDIWMHGHCHDSFSYREGRCQVIANPAGYVTNLKRAKAEGFLFENELFEKNLLVELVT